MDFYRSSYLGSKPLASYQFVRKAASPTPRFGVDEDVLRMIHWQEPWEFHPVASGQFLQKWEGQITKDDRVKVLAEANHLCQERYQIVDFGNFTEAELLECFSKLIQNIHNPEEGTLAIPPDVKYIVIGHGEGFGETWRFKNSETLVQDYINEHIPEGHGAWVITCDETFKPDIPSCEGRVIYAQATSNSRDN